MKRLAEDWVGNTKSFGPVEKHPALLNIYEIKG